MPFLYVFMTIFLSTNIIAMQLQFIPSYIINECGGLLTFNPANGSYEPSGYVCVPEGYVSASTLQQAYHEIDTASSVLEGFSRHIDHAFFHIGSERMALLHEHFDTWLARSMQALLKNGNMQERQASLQTLLSALYPGEHNQLVTQLCTEGSRRNALLLTHIGQLMHHCARIIHDASPSERVFYKKFIEIGNYYLGCALNHDGHISHAEAETIRSYIAKNRHAHIIETSTEFAPASTAHIVSHQEPIVLQPVPITPIVQALSVMQEHASADACNASDKKESTSVIREPCDTATSSLEHNDHNDDEQGALAEDEEADVYFPEEPCQHDAGKALVSNGVRAINQRNRAAVHAKKAKQKNKPTKCSARDMQRKLDQALNSLKKNSGDKDALRAIHAFADLESTNQTINDVISHAACFLGEHYGEQNDSALSNRYFGKAEKAGCAHAPLYHAVCLYKKGERGASINGLLEKCFAAKKINVRMRIDALCLKAKNAVHEKGDAPWSEALQCLKKVYELNDYHYTLDEWRMLYDTELIANVQAFLEQDSKGDAVQEEKQEWFYIMGRFFREYGPLKDRRDKGTAWILEAAAKNNSAAQVFVMEHPEFDLNLRMKYVIDLMKNSSLPGPLDAEVRSWCQTYMGHGYISAVRGFLVRALNDDKRAGESKHFLKVLTDFEKKFPRIQFIEQEGEAHLITHDGEIVQMLKKYQDTHWTARGLLAAFSFVRLGCEYRIYDNEKALATVLRDVQQLEKDHRKHAKELRHILGHGYALLGSLFNFRASAAMVGSSSSTGPDAEGILTVSHRYFEKALALDNEMAVLFIGRSSLIQEAPHDVEGVKMLKRLIKNESIYMLEAAHGLAMYYAKKRDIEQADHYLELCEKRARVSSNSYAEPLFINRLKALRSDIATLKTQKNTTKQPKESDEPQLNEDMIKNALHHFKDAIRLSAYNVQEAVLSLTKAEYHGLAQLAHFDGHNVLEEYQKVVLDICIKAKEEMPEPHYKLFETSCRRMMDDFKEVRRAKIEAFRKNFDRELTIREVRLAHLLRVSTLVDACCVMPEGTEKNERLSELLKNGDLNGLSGETKNDVSSAVVCERLKKYVDDTYDKELQVYERAKKRLEDLH